MTEADKKVETLETKILELETENAQLRESVKQKDAEIERLKQSPPETVIRSSPRVFTHESMKGL